MQHNPLKSEWNYWTTGKKNSSHKIMHLKTRLQNGSENKICTFGLQALQIGTVLTYITGPVKKHRQMNILHIWSSQEASRQKGSNMKQITNCVCLAHTKNPAQNKTQIQIKEYNFRAT